MNELNEKGQFHGYWVWYGYNGNLCYEGNYNNGKKDGYWEWYDSDGNLYEKEFYL
jgi:antitoxin component YwqK of YwqJK toxin-antitoxin module